jgi:ppGpp synthetase/RelA/SpoT-type nucleotidyltranferase
MEYSRTKIDKAGDRLAKGTSKNADEYLDSEIIFDEYRKIFIEPLTEITLKLHSWLIEFKCDFYIAERLKRKPQILRKLRRFSARLTQLQDIGGVRVIFDDNNLIDQFIIFIKEKISKGHFFKIERKTDYREKGRDDSGYRAVHLILSRNDVTIELQLRSQIQHNWAERIERTSVIYGHYLKELDGEQIVLDYFKLLSDVFHEIECGRKPSNEMIEYLEKIRIKSEEAILISDTRNVFNSNVNETFIKSMIGRDALLKGKFHNWLIVFNWKEGRFENWQVVEGKSDDAIKMYSELEKKWNAEDGYEVVMIGSSDVSMIRKTHSHYFGIDSYDTVLQSIDDSLLNFKKRSEFDHDARILLQCLYRRGNWNVKRVSYDTLKNHYCREIKNIDDSINILEALGFIVKMTQGKSYSLNVKKRKDIEKYV